MRAEGERGVAVGKKKNTIFAFLCALKLEKAKMEMPHSLRGDVSRWKRRGRRDEVGKMERGGKERRNNVGSSSCREMMCAHKIPRGCYWHLR